MTEIPFDEVLRRAVAGDRAAQDDVISTLLPQVRSLVHRELESSFRRNHPWLMPLLSTGDIVQEVVAGVVRSLGGLEIDEPDALARYVATLVRNRLLDAVRHHEAARRDRRRELGDAPSDAAAAAPDPTVAAMLAEQVRIFDDVLGSFSERHRTLLELRLRDGEPFGRIAERLGYASDETARLAFLDAHARLLVKLRARGVRPRTD